MPSLLKTRYVSHRARLRADKILIRPPRVPPYSLQSKSTRPTSGRSSGRRLGSQPRFVTPPCEVLGLSLTPPGMRAIRKGTLWREDLSHATLQATYELMNLNDAHRDGHAVPLLLFNPVMDRFRRWDVATSFSFTFAIITCRAGHVSPLDDFHQTHPKFYICLLSWDFLLCRYRTVF